MKKSLIVFLIVSQVIVAQQKNVVLELFTSQGCSSCPSADKLLKQVSESNAHSNVIPVAYHVDYWNRLGWKDPFSKTSFTNYQREYGRKFGARSIYTPQLVINGQQHIVGSDKSSLGASLSKLNTKRLPASISITDVKTQGTNVVLKYSCKLGANQRLSLVMLLKNKTTVVERGENRDRTLVDTHIVLDKQIITTNALSASDVIFKDVEFSLEELEFVAYVQKENLEVIGATQWK